MEKHYVLSPRTLDWDIRSEIGRFPEDLESNLFSVDKGVFVSFVRHLGERIGHLFVSYLIRKECMDVDKNHFCIIRPRYSPILEHPELYSVDLVQAFNSLRDPRTKSRVADIIMVKCKPHAGAVPEQPNADCPLCKEIYSKDPDTWQRKRIKESCGKLEEVLCFELRTSASRFESKKGFTPVREVLIEKAKKMDYVRLYLIKVDLSEFSENKFNVALERLG